MTAKISASWKAWSTGDHLTFGDLRKLVERVQDDAGTTGHGDADDAAVFFDNGAEPVMIEIVLGR